MNRPRFSGSFRHGFLLGGAAFLLLGLLWQGISAPPPAHAQVPDSGAQRQRMIKEMVTTNEKLTEVVNLLKQIRDQTAGDSDSKQPGTPRTPRP
jgi:type II secretory pathway component PulM